MNARDDIRRLRDRQDTYDAELAAVPDHGPEGAIRVVARTVDLGHYPMETGVFVAVERVSLSGDESEGAVVAVESTEDDEALFFACNLGTKPAVPGELVECVAVPYCWVFFCEGSGGGRALTASLDGDESLDPGQYRLVHLDPDGTPSSASFIAYNVGNDAPPLESEVPYYWATTRWNFRYDRVR